MAEHGRGRPDRVGRPDPHASTIVGPYQLQESGHASYWGQLAMRNCLRQVFNGGNVVSGGKCVRTGNGLTSRGEPVMTVQ